MSQSAPDRAAADRPLSPERLALLDRIRFILPLCQGRAVLDAGGDAELRAPLSGAAGRLLDAQSAEPAELLLSLAPLRGAALGTLIPGLRRRLAPGGILAVTVLDDPGAARAALAGAFAQVAVFRQRPIAGTLITGDRFTEARIVPLAGPAPAGPNWITLLLAADQELPPIACGVFEAVEIGPQTLARAAPAAPPPEPLDRPPPTPGLAELRGRAASLVARLVELDERAVLLEADAASARLRIAQMQAEGGGGGGGPAFDVPRTKHAWPVADHPDRPHADLTFYEHRPDDDAIDAGRAGEAFLREFGLLTGEPDFAAAIAAINALPRPAWLISADAAAPEASIVIPVYGQLAYTLNCLHSLLTHHAGIGAEIIVVDDRSPDETPLLLPGVADIRYLRNETNLGFLRSCNAAVRQARGRHVVLLNNDTRVLPDWLDALLGSFALFPRAGLVGSKLLYADGTLQEAGAIIWRDASAWNYGRNDDPNRPNYAHARQADYVSGASIAIPAALWRQLGGFDELFAPAYCEESDLALRLRAAGHEVWYQARSRVIHYEGRTSGTDTSSGVKKYQEVNGRKLFLRWRESLAGHRPNGEAPYFERERGVRQRALIVDATTPTPKQDAGSVTTLLTLRLFQDLGYKMYYAPQDNFLYEPAHTPELLRLGVECAYMPYEGPFDDYIRRYGALLDAILVYRVPVLEQVLDDLRRHAPRAPVLFHMMDLHFLRMERQAELDGTAAAREAAARMKAREIELIRRVDCTITHSTFERDLLAREAPEAPVVVWPFMFEFFGTQVGWEDRRDICFLGGYRHGPNIDAVQFFAREVMPLIWAEAPDVRFIVAGANPGPEVRELEGPRVVVTGLIDDLRDVFDRTRVFACPLRVGAGTKGKVSTAMSYGLPVVSTACGAEGMELIDGTDVLLADTPAELAAACLRVYRDPALWERLSQAGQALVREKHSLDMGRRVLAEAIEVALRHKLGLWGAART